jgi:phosphatidylserine/phosphatidylglycerophosphate/cardiolipin synthase-like enzyme
VYYGLTKNMEDTVALKSLDSIHTVTISGLKPGQIYYYQVASINSAGTSASFVAPMVTTSSASTGEMDVYFNYSVDTTYGLMPKANGKADLLGKLLNRIRSAAKTIDMAVYSFDDFNSNTNVASRIADSLIAAKNRGVKIRFVYDNRATTSPLAKLISAGIPVVKRSVPGTDNGIMHNKFFIFDGKDTASAKTEWVVTGSWNVTDDGTLSDAQDAMFIQDQSLARIYTVEFEEMFGSSSDVPNLAQAAFGPMKQDNTPHRTTIAGKKVEVFFSPSDHTTSNIIRVLSTADKNIFFGLLAFTRDDIAQTIINRKNAGAIVRGLIDQQPSVLATLKTAGVDALQAGHPVVTGLFHHKYGIVDPFNDNNDPVIILGSHNWSTAAEQDNDENTLMIHSGDIARQYVQEFAARYKESGGNGSITSVEQINNSIPSQFQLFQNYPNPFNPATVFSFQLPKNEKVKLVVYDVLGREIVTLLDAVKAAGTYQVTWNASGLTSGVYFYMLQAGTSSAVKKALLLK